MTYVCIQASDIYILYMRNLFLFVIFAVFFYVLKWRMVYGCGFNSHLLILLMFTYSKHVRSCTVAGGEPWLCSRRHAGSLQFLNGLKSWIY